MRLTDISVRALPPPTKGQKTHWDDSLQNFGCRVSQGGTKSFVVQHGSDRRLITIGRYPVISLADAREEAKRLLAEMTLGNLVRGAYGGLYERVDKLLRELENPNLHDIANMSFRVELWDRHALRIRWVIAASGSVFLARAAFEEAVKQWPDQKLTLRQGIMLISEHPSPLGNPR